MCRDKNPLVQIGKRASRNCALPDFDLGQWTGEESYEVYMGAPRDYSRHGDGDWATPHEDPDEIGCPGSWYRSGFVQSLLRYYRRRDDKGGRIPNPALDQCTDPLVHEAVVVLEGWEDEGWADYLDALRKAGE